MPCVLCRHGKPERTVFSPVFFLSLKAKKKYRTWGWELVQSVVEGS